jgi:hypothetical protein
MGIQEILLALNESNQQQIEQADALRYDVRLLDWKWRRGKILFFGGAAVLFTLLLIMAYLLFSLVGLAHQQDKSAKRQDHILAQVTALAEENRAINQVNRDSLAILQDATSPDGVRYKAGLENQKAAIAQIDAQNQARQQQLMDALNSIQAQLTGIKRAIPTTTTTAVRSTTAPQVGPPPTTIPVSTATTITVKGKGKK